MVAGMGRPTQWTAIVSAQSQMFLLPTTYQRADRIVSRPAHSDRLTQAGSNLKGKVADDPL